MGKLIEQLKKKAAQGRPPLGSGASTGAPQHTASYLYAKHLFDQGLGPNPDAATPATADTGSNPPGGMANLAEDQRRRNTGIQL